MMKPGGMKVLVLIAILLAVFFALFTVEVRGDKDAFEACMDERWPTGKPRDDEVYVVDALECGKEAAVNAGRKLHTCGG